MKFLSLLITLLCIYLCSSSLLVRHRRTKTGSNKWYQFVMGFLGGAGGIDDTGREQVNKCLPEKWHIVNAKEETDDKTDVAKKSLLTTVLDQLELVTGFVCLFKDKIAEQLGLQFKRMRYIRRFYQTQNSKKRIARMLGFWSSISDFLKDAGTVVIKGVKTAVAWAARKWEDVKSTALTILQQLTDWWSAFKIRATSFFEKARDFIVTVFGCLKNTAGVVYGLYQMVKGMFEKVVLIASIAAGNLLALAKLFIDLLCNWGSFRSAFNALGSALGEQDILKKYERYGEFTGYLMSALLSRRR
jgi:hypothetical protein